MLLLGTLIGDADDLESPESYSGSSTEEPQSQSSSSSVNLCFSLALASFLRCSLQPVDLVGVNSFAVSSGIEFREALERQIVSVPRRHPPKWTQG